MKIILIKSNMHKEKSKGVMQPLFAAALLALTPDDIEVKLYDDRIEDIPFDEYTDMVAISIETFCAKRSYEIASEYKKRGVKVVAGGFHPTILPDETSEYVDSVVIGDAENVWPEIICDLKEGKLKKLYSSENNTSDIEPKFDRRIFLNKSYGPIELVQWGRGCPYNCDFCSIKAFYKSKQTCRSIDSVCKEIEGLKYKTVFFVDDNLYHNREKFVLFLKEITSLKIKWTCQISIDVAKDDALLKLMKDSGCFLVLIGIESFNADNLKLMNKQWSTSGMNIEAAIKKFHDFGMMVYGTFIFGYDYDSSDSFKYAVDFAIKHKFFIANFNPLYPMPGTALYDRLKSENRLLYEKWWLDPEFYYGKSMFKPKSMTSDELEKYCFEAKKEFNSWQSILLRGLNPLVSLKSLNNLMLYFYINSANRREIFSKQGKILGQ